MVVIVNLHVSSGGQWGFVNSVLACNRTNGTSYDVPLIAPS